MQFVDQTGSLTNLVFDSSFDSESNGLHGMQETQTASNKTADSRR